VNNSLLTRFANEETMVAPDKMARFESCLRGAEAATESIEARLADGDQMALMDDFWPEPGDWRAAYRPYVVVDGILQIPVKGVLLNDFPWALGSWATGYDYIWRAFERGMGDLNVDGIALICDTPGGMVAGNFDLVDKMYAMRGTKPVAGFAHESAYSAGYSIISSADPGRVYVSRTGGVGSIGVVTTHVDQSKLMSDIGYAITFIHAGAHKVDGNPYEPLPASVKADIQERIDALYSIFVATVARNRGLDESAVRATEARCFMAPQALSNGLADHIGTLNDALADFSASLNPEQGDTTMADVTQADHEMAVTAARTEGETAGRAAAAPEIAAAVLQGGTDERARISAILESTEAATRPAAAKMLAFDTDKDPVSATAALGKLPEESASAPETSAAAPKGMFVAGMDGSPNPDLTDTAGGDDAEKNGESDIALARSFGMGGLRPAERQ
jgi:signal peptide peptidase SppA